MGWIVCHCRLAWCAVVAGDGFALFMRVLLVGYTAPVDPFSMPSVVLVVQAQTFVFFCSM